MAEIPNSRTTPRLVSGQTLLKMLAGSTDAHGNAGMDVPMLGTTRMPKIIHQSWKTATVTGMYGELRKTWQATYPNWLHVLWTDEDNHQLVKTCYPQYLDIYTSLTLGVSRADMVRSMYMYSFEGMYADLDFDSYKSIEPLFLSELEQKKNAAFLGRMAEPDEPLESEHHLHTFPNAWFASTPQHPFWLDILANVKLAWHTNVHIRKDKHARDLPEYIAGPVVLKRTYMEYTANDKESAEAKSSSPIIVLPPASLYGFPWYETKEFALDKRPKTLGDPNVYFDLAKMRRMFNNGDAYACTYWGASWKHDGWKPQIDCAGA